MFALAETVPPSNTVLVSKGKFAGLIATLLVLLVGSIVLLTASSPPEPSYHGGSASQWLAHFNIKNRKLGGDAQQALKAMGPDAAPVIFHRLETSETLLQIKYRLLYLKIPVRVAKFLPAPRAEFGRLDAMTALLAIGPAVEPALIRALESGSASAESRTAAAGTLASLLSGDGADIKDAVPALIRALGDENSNVGNYSAIALGNAGPAAAAAVPSLIAFLHDSNTGTKSGEKVFVRIQAVRALGKIGPKAFAAMPSLNPLLGHKDVYVRALVAIAIWRIGGNGTDTLPVLSQSLVELPEGLKWELIDAMAEMGPRAKAAVPLLLRELAVPKQPRWVWTSNCGKLTNALRQIDPEAAAKAGMR